MKGERASVLSPFFFFYPIDRNWIVAMYEVLVIENNQTSSAALESKPLAMWTEVFADKETAAMYVGHINEQNTKFSNKFKGKLTWTVMTIDYTGIPNSDLVLTLSPIEIEEYSV